MGQNAVVIREAQASPTQLRSQNAILFNEVGECLALGRTMVGLAMLSGLRRGELFALRWRDLDKHEGC